MRGQIRSITDVAERQLCTGCGICAYVQPQDIRMVDDPDAGRRPVVRRVGGVEPSTDAALVVCPGLGLSHGRTADGSIPELRRDWGPVLEVWEGFAADDQIRLAGSSGGAATALATYALDHQNMHGVLHIKAREDAPLLNETVLSTTRGELLAATGSRYAPASPCDRLDLVADAPGPCVFIGKPCDVAATARARQNDPVLDEKLGLTIAIFCAGTPTLRGTYEMLDKMGIEDPAAVRSLRFRGNGWPGLADAEVHTGSGTEHRTLTYDESWGDVLQKHRQWRCYVCADHTGEFADIAVGDPWYRSIEPGEPGRSLLLVRTERGRDLLRAALRGGAITAERVDADRVPASQPGLRRVRGAVWGRIVTSRLLGVPAPRYQRMPTFPAWWSELSLVDKLRSTLGLARRIRRRGLWVRHPVSPLAENQARPRQEDDSPTPDIT